MPALSGEGTGERADIRRAQREGRPTDTRQDIRLSAGQGTDAILLFRCYLVVGFECCCLFCFYILRGIGRGAGNVVIRQGNNS